MSGPFGSNQFFGVSASDPAYVPKGSIWFDRGNSYLTRTPGSAGNRRTYSLSCWIKFSTLSADQVIWDAAPSGQGNEDMFLIRSDNIPEWMSAGYDYARATPQVLRDPTAWYHILIVIDSTNVVASQRALMWINGKPITNAAGNTMSLNYDSPYWNNTNLHSIGNRQHPTVGASSRYGGYLSEAISLDGYAATPSDFGQYNSKGVWVPIDPTDLVTANKGSLGFWLDFADSSDLGNDVSGNNNDWALTGLSSTNASADRCADEKEDTGNYPTFNPLIPQSAFACSEGNLKAVGTTSASHKSTLTTTAVYSGKWYYEHTVTALSGAPAEGYYVGVQPASGAGSLTEHLGDNSDSFAYTDTGDKCNNNSFASYGDTFTAGDVIGVALDLDNGKIFFSKNGTWQNSGDPANGGNAAYTSLSTTTGYIPAFSVYNTGTAVLNFGQTAFSHTPPTGFKKINTSNMSAPAVSKSSDNFLPIIYEGNGTGQRVGNFIPFTDIYAVNYSARFDEGDPDYLSRTFRGAGSGTGKTWTYSVWVKRGDLSAGYGATLFGCSTGGSNGSIKFDGPSGTVDNGLALWVDNGTYYFRTNQKVTTSQSWVNIVIAVDTSQGSATDRVKIYINGSEVTSWQEYDTLPINHDTSFGQANEHFIGYNIPNSGQPYDGYMAEACFVDGYALSASVFGQTDTSTNRWIPKEVTTATLNSAGGGSSGWGNNGFYFPFPQKTAYGLDTSQGASAALDAQTLFLASFDGSDAATSATDTSNFVHTITFAGNAQLDTAIKKFGTAALLLDGSGDYVSMASFPALGSNAFCIEGWAYLTDGSGTQLAFIGNRDGGADDDSWLINIGGTAKRMSVRTDNTEVMSSNTDITLNTWTHIAYTWDGATNRLFQAGALVASSTSFSPNYSDTNTLYIGHDGRGTTNDWPGSIDEVRVVKGSAVYTSTFTPPASAYSAPAAGNMFVPFSMDQTYGSNQMYDTPTRNTAVISQGFAASTAELTQGNLTLGGSSGDPLSSPFTIQEVSSGKWYFEGRLDAIDTSTGGPSMGFALSSALSNSTNTAASPANYYTMRIRGGPSIQCNNDGVSWQPSNAPTVAVGTVYGLFIDCDNGKAWGAVDGTIMQNSAGDSVGSPSTGTNPTFLFPNNTAITFFAGGSNAGDITINTGAWIYFDGATTTLDSDAGGYFQSTSIPTGFKALNQDNLPENTAGITGFAWIKNRDAADSHILADRVRGAGLYLESDDSAVEATNTNSVQRFLQQGVQVGNMDAVNTDGESYVLWQWAGNGTGTTNSDGSGADVTVSANATAGFSIVKYVGDDTSGRTIGTGLTAQPAFILIKNMDNASYDWQVYHQSIGNTASLSLNINSGPSTSSTYWNDTSPATSTPFVFSLGNSVATNKASDDFIAYVWAEVAGYSQFGEYTGNNSTDGPVINMSFAPAYFMFKRTDGNGDWYTFDSSRNTYNPANNILALNSSNNESTMASNSSNGKIDFLSNGIKFRSGNGSDFNGSGAEFIYAAFAENPFGGSGVAPATAR